MGNNYTQLKDEVFSKHKLYCVDCGILYPGNAYKDVHNTLRCERCNKMVRYKCRYCSYLVVVMNSKKHYCYRISDDGNVYL